MNACTLWHDCAPGQYVNFPGSVLQDRTCLACASGFQSTTLNQVSCISLSSSDCPPGQFVSRVGSATLSQLCSACAAGKFSLVTNALSCNPCTTSCADGVFLSGLCSATTTPTCLACPSGSLRFALFCFSLISNVKFCCTGLVFLLCETRLIYIYIYIYICVCVCIVIFLGSFKNSVTSGSWYVLPLHFSLPDLT